MSNGCAHDKKNPLVYVPPPEHKKRPRVLAELEKKGASLYKLIKKELRDGYTHGPRSEARDAAQAACCCGLHYLNLATMTIEIPPEGSKGNAGENVGVGYAYYDKHLRIGYDRIQRAFGNVLYKIGWVEEKRDWRRLPNGQVEWLPSLRKFTPKFFAAVGKLEWYNLHTGRADKKDDKRHANEGAIAKAAQEGPEDPLVALYKRVGASVENISQAVMSKVWTMILGGQRDEDAMVAAAEQLMAEARAPP